MKRKTKTSSKLRGFLEGADTISAAKGLLGCTLQTVRRGIVTSGIIVETEAYDGTCDEACHAFGGITKRTATMFGPPGHAYVYLIYGMHYCVNVVADKPGIGSAVLIRALEPLEGLEAMRKRRSTHAPKNLCSGPAKLCEALEIAAPYNGKYLFDPGSPITLFGEPSQPGGRIIETTRIGISKATDLPWRFYLSEKREWVSKI